MATYNIEMNRLNEDGSYDVLYPENPKYVPYTITGGSATINLNDSIVIETPTSTDGYNAKGTFYLGNGLSGGMAQIRVGHELDNKKVSSFTICGGTVLVSDDNSLSSTKEKYPSFSIGPSATHNRAVLDCQGGSIIKVSDPILSHDVATKNYVDSLVSGGSGYPNMVVQSYIGTGSDINVTFPSYSGCMLKAVKIIGDFKWERPMGYFDPIVKIGTSYRSCVGGSLAIRMDNGGSTDVSLVDSEWVSFTSDYTIEITSPRVQTIGKTYYIVGYYTST